MVDKLSEFYKLLNNEEDREYIELFVSYSIALISAKLKPSITLNLVKNDNKRTYDLWKLYGESYIKSLGLKYIELRESERSLIVLIYDEELLEKAISNPENLKFLMSIGYKYDFSLKQCVEKLKERYALYACPHELGVFLGYPIDDVRDFMECTEKKCLACGYWKVYNSISNAETIFNLYDEVKEHTLDNILIGKRHKILCGILKSKFENKQCIVFG